MSQRAAQFRCFLESYHVYDYHCCCCCDGVCQPICARHDSSAPDSIGIANAAVFDYSMTSDEVPSGIVSTLSSRNIPVQNRRASFTAEAAVMVALGRSQKEECSRHQHRRHGTYCRAPLHPGYSSFGRPHPHPFLTQCRRHGTSGAWEAKVICSPELVYPTACVSHQCLLANGTCAGVAAPCSLQSPSGGNLKTCAYSAARLMNPWRKGAARELEMLFRRWRILWRAALQINTLPNLSTHLDEHEAVRSLYGASMAVCFLMCSGSSRSKRPVHWRCRPVFTGTRVHRSAHGLGMIFGPAKTMEKAGAGWRGP